MRFKHIRQILFDWVDNGSLATFDLNKAMELSKVYPTPKEGKKVLDIILLALGILTLGSGVIFFFAYNWKAMGYFLKFGLVELLIAGSLIAVWIKGINKKSGKAALTITCIFTGVLLALIGQTYQTGADTYQLFALWALFILPWVILARFSVIWLLWLLLINTSAFLYYRTFVFFMDFSSNMVPVFILNTIAIIIWEFTMKTVWIRRVIATICCGSATIITFLNILDEDFSFSTLVYPLLIIAAYIFYRRIKCDIFILAQNILSFIIITATFLVMKLEVFDDNFSLLFLIGIIVIGLSAAGGWWLKKIGKEVQNDK